jgi:hypothetical protein
MNIFFNRFVGNNRIQKCSLSAIKKIFYANESQRSDQVQTNRPMLAKFSKAMQY